MPSVVDPNAVAAAGEDPKVDTITLEVLSPAEAALETIEKFIKNSNNPVEIHNLVGNLAAIQNSATAKVKALLEPLKGLFADESAKSVRELVRDDLEEQAEVGFRTGAEVTSNEQ